jgi:predicted PurR-regulated permease PerM
MAKIESRVGRSDARRTWQEISASPRAAVAAIAVVAALGALWAGAAFFVPVVMATTLAVLLWPAVQWLQRWLRLRALAAFLVLGAATTLTVATAMGVAAQISAAGDHLPNVLHLAARDVASLGSAGAAKWRRAESALQELDRSVARATGTARASESVRDASRPSIVSTMVQWSAAVAVGATKATFGALARSGAIVLLTFFLLCSGDELALRLSRWCDDRPRARGRYAALVSETALTMRRFAAVTLLTDVGIGLAVALGFLAFGVDEPWTWGLVAGALHLVPYAGLAVMMGLAGIEVYSLHGSPIAGLVAMGYVLVIAVLLGTVLMAWLRGRASNVDSALMFAATVFFGVLWGGWGLVLGPLLVVSAQGLLRPVAQAPSRAALVPVDPTRGCAIPQGAE